MKTVVIRRAQARQDDGADRIPLSQGVAPQKGRQVKTLPFHENVLNSVGAFPAHVPGIRGKNGRILPAGQRASSRFQAAVEKIVEMPELPHSLERIFHINAVLLHKGGNGAGAGRAILQPTQQTGKNAAFNQDMQCRLPRSSAVNPLHILLPQYLLPFLPARIAVVIAYVLHETLECLPPLRLSSRKNTLPPVSSMQHGSFAPPHRFPSLCPRHPVPPRIQILRSMRHPVFLPGHSNLAFQKW